MSLPGVKRYLKEYGLDGDIIELHESSATVQEAASALHTEPDRIAKSLSFLVDERPVVVVVSGQSKVDNHKYKAFFHKKAKMIPSEDVERLTGHPVGGVCPFDLPGGVDVYLDESLKKYDAVYPACGSTSSAIRITLPDLERTSRFLGWVYITSDPA